MSDQSTATDEYSPVDRVYLRERRDAETGFRDNVSDWLRLEEPFAFGVHNLCRFCAEYFRRALTAFTWRTFQNGARGDLAIRTVKQRAAELIEDITRFKCAAVIARIRLCTPPASDDAIDAELVQLPTVLTTVADEVIASWEPVFWELEPFSASLVNLSIPDGVAVALEDTFTPFFAITLRRQEQEEQTAPAASDNAPAKAVLDEPPEPAPKRGRPQGEPVDAEALRRLRGEYSQEDLADKCGVSVDTIQRGEHGGRWDRRKFEIVAAVLTQLNGRIVTVKDLTPQKMQ